MSDRGREREKGEREGEREERERGRERERGGEREGGGDRKITYLIMKELFNHLPLTFLPRCRHEMDMYQHVIS